MAFDRKKLLDALDVVKKYHGISGVDDLLRTIALESVVERPVAPESTSRPINQANEEEFQVLETLFHDKTALYSISDIIKKLSDITAQNQNIIPRINRTFQIFHEEDTNGIRTFIENEGNNSLSFVGTHRSFSPISKIVSMPGGNIENRIFNRGTPTKTNPGLSVMLCNTHRLSFNQYFGDLISIWMNGIPTQEIAKATPFFTIEFNTPRAPIDSQGRLAALGLNKILFGAKDVSSNEEFIATTRANQSSVNIQGNDSVSTIAGMELFTNPVSLGTADLTTAEHSARILDPRMPLLSIEDLAINVAPSTGLMSFKRATLTMRLHDRSRLSDIAEFIRPEYYGLNEIMIEYGWIHPDAELLVQTNVNPYADIINNIRVKEKYGIINSSYNFDNSGGVKIALELAMRGTTEMFTETIASNQESLQNIMAEIQMIRETIDAIRQRFPDGRVMGREIRGFDVINNLSDSSFNFTVGREFLTELSRIRTTVSHVPQLSDLSNAINRLISQNGNSGIIRDVQRTILQEIQQKIASLIGSQTEDPMLLVVNDDLSVTQAQGTARTNSGLYAELPASGPRSREITNALSALGVNSVSDLPNGQFSLAKLLLEFVGIPLTATNKYDDIQFIFYPFNIYAGRANRLNVGNFGIDARFFVVKYMEWRLGRLNQSLNVSLHEFMRFVIDQIVAEPSSKSYGLYAPESSRRSGGGVNRGFRYYVENGSVQVRYEEPGTGRRASQEAADGGSYLQQLNRALRDVTPNAEFRPPQIEFYVEALPMKEANGTQNDTNNAKTVLRIHVYDRVATSLESLSQLETSARNSSIQSIGTAWTQSQSAIRNVGAVNPDGDPHDRPQFPTDDEANRIIDSAKEMLEATIRRALDDGIIEVVQAVPTVNEGDSSVGEPAQTTRYRFVGGPETLREFFKKTSPHMIYGVAGTTVKNASFHSMNQGSSELATVNMLRSSTRAELQSNGENPGGLPMQVSPGQCELTILGNPLIPYAQSLFCDFQTGTTIDNFYAIVSIKHALGPGKFETKLELTPVDGWGKYINIENIINGYTQQISDLSEDAHRQLTDLRLANRPTPPRRARR